MKTTLVTIGVVIAAAAAAMQGTYRSDAFAVLTNDERKAALDILRETPPDLRR